MPGHILVAPRFICWKQLTHFPLIYCRYLLCLQIDRYITMWHPTKAHHKTSNRHSRCITSILGILGVVIYSLILWTSSVHKDVYQEDKFVCNFITKYTDIIRIFVKADAFVTAVMPYSMLPMVNIIICLQIVIKCCGLQKYKGPVMAPGIRSNRILNNIRKTRKQVWLTFSLLIVSTIIWCLNILSQWFRIRHFFKFDSSDLDLMTPKHRGHSLWHLADHLYHLSFAVKLLLYLIFSGLFRTSVVDCCRSYQCICSQGNDGDDDVSSTCEHCECDHSYDGSLEALPPLDQDLDPNLDNLSDLQPINSDNSPCDNDHSPTVDYSHLSQPTENHITSNHIIRRDTTVWTEKTFRSFPFPEQSKHFWIRHCCYLSLNMTSELENWLCSCRDDRPDKLASDHC